jgi:hypothetical protein
MTKFCPICNAKVLGRADKLFCGIACKNTFNYQQKASNQSATKDIDGYLHRNREILALLMGSASKITLEKIVLDRTGFKYPYHTSHYINKEGKTYWLVYDYAWMDFANGSVLIVKRGK